MMTTAEDMNDREYWLKTALTIGDPMFDACEAGELYKRFPSSKRPLKEDYGYLEVTGRYISGIAPWIELPHDDSKEGRLRAQYAVKTRKVLDAISDPDSPDCVQWAEHFGKYGERQPIVDASYVALALVRAPRELVEKLDDRVKQNLIHQFQVSAKILPVQNNWLLFAAMIETALFLLGAEWDKMRIDYAIRKHMDWYVGDGLYSDGDNYHWDYYNSYVIHPYLVDIMRVLGDQEGRWTALKDKIWCRSQRYAEILERLISPEGAFPPVGRSLTYRFGAFQTLTQMALLHALPESLTPAQVRCAVTAAIQRIMDAPGNFDEEGWLQTGFCGHQPALAEPYMSVGSQYICANVFLALGLPEDDPFWSDPPELWTSQKIYGGYDLPLECALEGRNEGYPHISPWHEGIKRYQSKQS